MILSPMFAAVMTLIAVVLPTVSAALTEWLRRTNPGACARHRRPHALLAVAWVVQAGLNHVTSGDPERFWAFIYGAAAYAWAWWRGGGGEGTRRLLDKGTGLVRRHGARLIVVPVPSAA